MIEFEETPIPDVESSDTRIESTVLDIGPASALGTVGSEAHPAKLPLSSRRFPPGLAPTYVDATRSTESPISTPTSDVEEDLIRRSHAQASSEPQSLVLGTSAWIPGFLRRGQSNGRQPRRAKDSGLRMNAENETCTLPPEYSAD